MSVAEVQGVDGVLGHMEDHMESVAPGQPARFTEACQAGDAIWQGDLCIALADRIPDGYVKVEHPEESDLQLVPGNTVGARHCLDSLDGVELYRPQDWGSESLNGPAFVLTEERTVLHQKHGDVTIPAGFTVVTGYQREWDAEQKRERRAKD